MGTPVNSWETAANPCQGEGRGFESRRPLHAKAQVRGPLRGLCSRPGTGPSILASIRGAVWCQDRGQPGGGAVIRRKRNGWEVVVYYGRDATGRRQARSRMAPTERAARALMPKVLHTG